MQSEQETVSNKGEGEDQPSHLLVYIKLCVRFHSHPEASTCRHVYACTHMCMCIDTYKHVRAQTCTHTSVHTDKHVCTHKHAHTQKHAHRNKHTRTHTNTCVHKHASTNARTHTHTLVYCSQANLVTCSPVQETRRGSALVKWSRKSL